MLPKEIKRGPDCVIKINRFPIILRQSEILSMRCCDGVSRSRKEENSTQLIECRQKEDINRIHQDAKGVLAEIVPPSVCR